MNQLEENLVKIQIFEIIYSFINKLYKVESRKELIINYLN
jgi:hypothetical protein